MTATNLARSCLVSLGPLSSQVGSTALMWGALNGHVRVVEMLLAAGANKDMQSNVGRPQTSDQEDDECCKTLPYAMPSPCRQD